MSEIELCRNGIKICIIETYLLYNDNTNERYYNQSDLLCQLSSIVTSNTNEGSQVIVLGDFNMDLERKSNMINC